MKPDINSSYAPLSYNAIHNQKPLAASNGAGNQDAINPEQIAAKLLRFTTTLL